MSTLTSSSRIPPWNSTMLKSPFHSRRSPAIPRSNLWMETIIMTGLLNVLTLRLCLCGSLTCVCVLLVLSRRSVLEWQLAVVDRDNKEGSMEFSVNGNRADDFFPVEVSFSSTKTYAGISVRAWIVSTYPVLQPQSYPGFNHAPGYFGCSRRRCTSSLFDRLCVFHREVHHQLRQMFLFFVFLAE
jgi:hypothetical protein